MNQAWEKQGLEEDAKGRHWRGERHGRPRQWARLSARLLAGVKKADLHQLEQVMTEFGMSSSKLRGQLSHTLPKPSRSGKRGTRDARAGKSISCVDTREEVLEEAALRRRQLRQKIQPMAPLSRGLYDGELWELIAQKSVVLGVLPVWPVQTSAH